MGAFSFIKKPADVFRLAVVLCDHATSQGVRDCYTAERERRYLDIDRNRLLE